MENSTSNKQKDWLLPGAILTAAIIIAGSVIYSTGLKNYQSDKNTVQVGNVEQKELVSSVEAILGDPSAPVTVIEFGDFQCPYCAKFFHETEGQIVNNYVDTGKAKIVYKPLAFLGPESDTAALAALCARDQGKFWEFHNAIFEAEWKEVEDVIAGKLSSNENNGNLTRDFFEKTAQDLGMDKNSFLACYDLQKYQSEIKDNSNQANIALNGRISTPSFLINGKIIQGALPFSEFSKTIDEALLKK